MAIDHTLLHRAAHSIKELPYRVNHELRPFLHELARFSSTEALARSPLYARLKPEIEKVLGRVVEENLASEKDPSPSRSIKAVAWNIERGIRLEGIISMLSDHPHLRGADALLLTELDCGMARTGNRFVAREIAEALDLNYVFAPCYLALNKGSGLESRATGENQEALHGNAVFSRYPLRRAHAIALPNGKDKMRGKEKRLGQQRAVVADMYHPLAPVRIVSLHLDAHSSQRHRHRQMKLVLEHLDKLEPRLPVLIGGDWNTSTYNSRRALYSILGFWRRVMMGVGHVIRNHYPYPERLFERNLFRELEYRGYRYRDLNKLGTGTLHYDVKDLAANTNMADWVPGWCFWFINWALRKNGGRCSLKLDWFTGKDIAPDFAETPAVVGDLRDSAGPLSDHDAIVLSFIPDKESAEC